jgi:hypothetical protein
MWAYDQTVDPPAPFVEIHVSRPFDPTQRELVRAKLDTAADISCIPIELADRLGLFPGREILAEGYDGTQTLVATYDINLEIAARQSRHLEVVSIPEQYALLGRDVLNHFYTWLYGPELTFGMSILPERR